VIAPALAVLIAAGLVALVAAPSLLVIRTAPADANWGLTILLTVAFVGGYGLMAMLWHRHALATPQARPFSLRLFVGYMWRVVLLGVIQLGFSIAIVIPLLLSALIGQNGGPAPHALSELIATFLTHLLLIWVSLRLSVILPAAALGAPLAISESWAKTSAISRPLWGVAVIFAAVNTALTVVIALINARTPLTALLVELPIYIVQGMLIFGVLTTLYAHLMQNSVTGRIPGLGRIPT